MNICMIGTGYVGLVTGACFAGSGNNVACVDIDKEKIKSLSKGKVTFFEPGLEDLVKENYDEGRLTFTTDLKSALDKSEIVFIAVGTPPKEDGSADLSAVTQVAKSIGKHMTGYKIIVTKSTVPVGTSEMIKDTVSKETNIEFDVASNPEFLKEGAAVEDFMKPDRVVIGVDKKCFKEFRMPIESAVREIKRIYGNIILFKSTARSNTSSLKPEAKIFTI